MGIGERVSSGDCSSIDEYIRGFPSAVREKLEIMRRIIARETPGAEEIISYRMPAFRLVETLVYFATFSRHIGFYPTSGPIAAFRDELKHYKTSKGAVRFPLDEALPVELIGRMVRFRVEETSRRYAARSAAENKAAKGKDK
ncbi:MAG: DUF1801 domain-containing protein [Spirochaetes bacterium]|nr:DUF1801 domain-containing protein [Spirochaetota bacterium]